MALDDSVSASFFNKPIKFQLLPRVEDGSGGNSNNVWSTVYSCFAHIDDFPFAKGMSRNYTYGQLYPTMDALVTIRYQASTTLTPAMTILYRNRRYQILGLKIPHEELVSILIPVRWYQAQGTPA